MSGKAVIKAAQMFTTTGQASKVSAVREIAIGTVLGVGFGLLWQVRVPGRGWGGLGGQRGGGFNEVPPQRHRPRADTLHLAAAAH